MADTTKLPLLIAAVTQALQNINTAINTRTAPDSVMLGGKTLAQLETQFGADAAQQISLLATDLSTFIARRDNPHVVTKAQVGLGDVVNAGFATQAEAEAGEAANVYASPASIKQHLSVWWAAQLGTTPETLDTIEEIATAIGNNADAIEAIQSVAAGKETPAGAQAKVDAAVLSLTALIDGKLGKTEQAADSAKLEGKTLAQVITDAQAAVSDDIGGKLDATAQAVDSAKLEGKSIADLTASSAETVTGVVTNKFATPAGVKAAVDAAAVDTNSQIEALELVVTGHTNSLLGLRTDLDAVMDQLTAVFDNASELFVPAEE